MSPVDETSSPEALLETWLRSEDARSSATRLVAKYRLSIDASDLLNEAWVRLVSSVRRGNASFTDMRDPTDAAKYGFRTLDNLCRDHVRQRQTRGEVVAFDDERSLLPVMESGFDAVEQREFLERLLFAVSAVVMDRPMCAGCSKGVAEAAALEAVHLMLGGEDTTDSNRPWLDQLLYRAMESVDPDHSTRSADARRQRKLRCGKCAKDILADGLLAMGLMR